MVEQQYVATARSYLIAPEVLGPLAAHQGAVHDAMSAAALFAITSRAQSDLTRVVAQASAEGKRLATLSLTADIRFESAEQREAFTAALERAIVELTARHSSPFTTADGSAGPGRPFRLFVGCHPIPRQEPEQSDEEGNTALERPGSVNDSARPVVARRRPTEGAGDVAAPRDPPSAD
jgi:hypothetical protein